VGDLLEGLLPQAMAEVGEGAIGNRLPEIEATKETELGIVAQRRGKLAMRLNLVQVDEKLSLEQGDWIIAIRALREVFVTHQGIHGRKSMLSTITLVGSDLGFGDASYVAKVS
jgi:hypothetical protein